jgi:hypothetical protein
VVVRANKQSPARDDRELLSTPEVIGYFFAVFGTLPAGLDECPRSMLYQTAPNAIGNV